MRRAHRRGHRGLPGRAAGGGRAARSAGRQLRRAGRGRGARAARLRRRAGADRRRPGPAGAAACAAAAAAQGDHRGRGGAAAGRGRPARTGRRAATAVQLRDRALLEFLYGTGARISEAVGLDIDELDLAGEEVVRLSGKGGKQRIVPVGSYASQALQAYLVRARPALAAAAARSAAPPARARRPPSSSTPAAAG